MSNTIHIILYIPTGLSMNLVLLIATILQFFVFHVLKVRVHCIYVYGHLQSRSTASTSTLIQPNVTIISICFYFRLAVLLCNVTTNTFFNLQIVFLSSDVISI